MQRQKPNTQPKLPITQKILAESKNPIVREFVEKDKYSFTADAQLIKKYPQPSNRRVMSTFWADFIRNMHMKNCKFDGFEESIQKIILAAIEERKQLQLDNPETAQHENINAARAILQMQFPGEFEGIKYCDLILEHWSQAPIAFADTVVRTWAIENDYDISQEVGAEFKRNIDLYWMRENGVDKVYLEIIDPGFTLIKNNIDRQTTIPGTTITFQLTNRGFVFTPEKSCALGQDCLDIFKGVNKIFLQQMQINTVNAIAPSNLNYDNNNIDDIIDEIAAAELADQTKYHTTLLESIAEGYAYIFRHHDDETAMARFASVISWPFKLVGEFIPEVIRCLAKSAADNISNQFFSDEHYISNPLLRYPTKILAGGFLLVTRLIEGTANLTELVMARITSPIRSYEDAKKIHPALGVLSALTTIAGTMTVAIVAAPLLPVIGLGGAAAWVVGHTGVIGPFFAAISSKLAGLMGLAVSPAAAALSTMVGSIYTFVMMPVHRLINKLTSEKSDNFAFDQIAASNFDIEEKAMNSNAVINKLLPVNQNQIKLTDLPDDDFVQVDVVDNGIDMESKHDQENTGVNGNTPGGDVNNINNNTSFGK